MKKFEFKTSIAASPERVWKTMLEPATYNQWIDAGWPGSTYEGEWKEGANIIFSGPGGGGTQAKLLTVRPFENVDMEHIAIVNKDGSLDTESEMAQGWVGSREIYRFVAQDGGTELTVELVTNPDWEDMLQEGWNDGLKKLKELAENKNA
jgi:uncharacterized protein YndB with AHSA1/START domain